jgi:aminoglycoside 3-N-acetyltransferase
MHQTKLCDLKRVIESFKLPRSKVVILHSSLLSFGRIDFDCQTLFEELVDWLGPETTLIMPTFTLSFGKSRSWHYHHSRSETGALTEFMRLYPGVMRTIHPFHSLAVWGPEARTYAACTQLSSFGPNSPFDLLYEHDAWNISLGTEFQGGATYLHHTEEMQQVPYRAYKSFPGEVINSHGDVVDRTFCMYARLITPQYEYKNTWTELWRRFQEEKLFLTHYVGPAKIYLSRIRPAHDRYRQWLLQDPFFTAELFKLENTLEAH